jgi:beta-glucosidase
MKKFITNHFYFHRGMSNVFIALLTLFVCVYTVSIPWRSTIDSAFGVESNEITLSDNVDDYKYKSRFKTATESIESQKELAKRIQQEGTVLLKGDPDELKVNGDMGVTLFGMRSYMTQFGSSIGSTVSKKEDQLVSLSDALTDRGFSVNQTTQSLYKGLVKQYVPTRADSGNNATTEIGAVINEVPQSEYNAIDNSDYVGFQDAAIIVLGRDAGESSSFYPGKSGIGNPEEFSTSETGNILGLSDDEKELVEYVKTQGFNKIIVLLNSVVTMEIEELKNDTEIDSILWIGTPGTYGFYGVADILKGTVLPSGHLSNTYAVNTAKSPAAQNYGVYNFLNGEEIDPSATGDKPQFKLRSNWYVAETESIYIGYKYYETRYYDSVMGQGNATVAARNETFDGGDYWDYENEVTYSFGYGIEGSDFSEEVVSTDIDWSGDNDSTINIEVTNVGDRGAKHVVQLYVQVPYTEYDRQNGVEKSAIQLVGYGKTNDGLDNVLEPGEKETVTITFNVRDFSSYDKNFEHDGVTGAYRLSEGDYYFATGNGAHDAVQCIIKAQDASKLVDVTPTGIIAGRENLSSDINFTTSINGGLVQNRFGDADINNMGTETSVTYLSRNNWSETFPEEVLEFEASPEMMKQLQNQTLDLEAANANAGEVEFVFSNDNGVTAFDMKGITDFDNPIFETVVQASSMDNVLNSLMGNVLVDQATVTPRPYPSDSPLGYIVPYGKYNRSGIHALNHDDEGYGYEPNVFSSGTVVASTFSHKLAEEQGMQMADDGFWSGVNWWFGPGLNLQRTPYNGRNIEYYSEDSVLSGIVAVNVITAYQDMGMIAGVKHFAFNDQEANRDGIAVFFDEQGGRENELRAFEYAMVKAKTKSVMTGFNRIGTTFTSADEGLISGLTRVEWGYKGFILTDSTKSAAYMRANESLMAGTNMMLGGFTHFGSGKEWEDIDASTIKDNPALLNAIIESYQYYLYTLADTAALDGITEDSTVGSTAIWEMVLIISIVLFSICSIIALLFSILSFLNVRKAKLKGREIA